MVPHFFETLSLIHFHKYEGTGNDFIIVEDALSREDISRMCDRRRGIGADGVLMISQIESRTVRMIIVNADGSRPEMCGNGVRCVARHMVEQFNFPDAFTVVSDAGEKACVVHRDDGFSVNVNMGQAVIKGHFLVSEDSRELRIHSVDIGNPHAIIFDEEDSTLLDKLGARFNTERALFQSGVNLEFVQRDGDELHVVVFERGVGRTHACGTGACAVAFAAWESEYIEQGPVKVRLPGGLLTIESREDGIWMDGAVNAVFSGKYLR